MVVAFNLLLVSQGSEESIWLVVSSDCRDLAVRRLSLNTAYTWLMALQPFTDGYTRQPPGPRVWGDCPVSWNAALESALLHQSVLAGGGEAPSADRMPFHNRSAARHARTADALQSYRWVGR